MTFEKIESALHRHPIISVLTAPILGGLFALAFPVIVIVMILLAAMRLVYSGVKTWATANAHLASFSWRPGMANLFKSNKDKDDKNS